MGKSPAKWIKSVLFGKKTSKSNAAKGKESLKSGSIKGSVEGKAPASAEGSPVISEPVLVSTRNTATIPAIQVVESPTSANNGVVRPTASEAPLADRSNEHVAVSGTENVREGQAAVQVQAVFRGYLARRAFRALRGIIRLQALIRGHLVRRQAVATLRATWLIVKVQAVVRGRIARQSSIANGIVLKLQQAEFGDANQSIAWKDRLPRNAYIHRLLSLPIAAESLHFQYDQKNANSALSWSERWTASRVWKPASHPKRSAEPKSHTRKASYIMETESGKLKRNSRRTLSTASESFQTNTCSEPEKLKRQLKKLSTAANASEATQDSNISELEKVKRSLRKVTSSMAESSDRSAVENGRSSRKTASSATEQSDRSISEIAKPSADIPDETKVDASTPQTSPTPEIAAEQALVEGRLDELSINPVAEAAYMQKSETEECNTVRDELAGGKEEQVQHSSETIKNNGRRRSSFSGKSEFAENGSQNAPPLPSYMAATESAKAKLRGQNSPRLGSDSAEKATPNSAEKNGMTRRHSLPSPANGKLNSCSPRTQRPSPGSGKGGAKNDKSLPSANDRAIQVEWRR